MITTAPRSCFCGCGRQYSRPRSWPLCPDATRRAWAAVRSIEPLTEFNAVSRRNGRFWTDEQAIRAALAGDLDGADRRIIARANPDRVPVAS